MQKERQKQKNQHLVNTTFFLQARSMDAKMSEQKFTVKQDIHIVSEYLPPSIC